MADETHEIDANGQVPEVIVAKKKRGRPRKENKEQVIQMRSYLETGSCGFDVVFGKNRKLQHSPVNVKKDNEREEKDASKEKERREEDEEEDEITEDETTEEEDDSKESKGNGQKEATETADSAANTKEKEGRADLSTEGNEEDKEAAAGRERKGGIEETTEGGTGPSTGTAREDSALELRFVKLLESKIGRLSDDRKRMESEMRKLKEQLDNEIAGKREMCREIEIIKERREEDRSRLEKLEEEIERIKEDRIVTTAVENTERNVNNALGSSSREVNGNEGEGREEGEIGVDEIEDRQAEGGNNDRNNNVGIEKRKYLEVIPDRLGEEELEWEMAERRSRKKSIVIRGIRTTGAKLKEEIKGIMKEKLDVAIYIKRIRAIGGCLVVDLDSMENKIEIMRRKMLKGMKLWIEDDLTNREKEIQNSRGRRKEFSRIKKEEKKELELSHGI